MPYDPANKTLKYYLQPSWPAPSNVKAFCTTRRTTPNDANGYANFNLAMHVGDTQNVVENNRRTLFEELTLPTTPYWLRQIHSNQVLEVTPNTPPNVEADASFTRNKKTVCVILTADCLPILLCDQNGTEVAALHCGWRGLYHNLIQHTLRTLKSPPQELIAWLGPAISSKHYQVGQDLKNQFVTHNKLYADAFSKIDGNWNLDLYKLARIILNNAGVTVVSGGEYCTFSNNDQFYSHRLQGPATGRIASLIWME